MIGYLHLTGQKLIVNGCVGYGLYQLKDLKNFQTDLKNSMQPLQVASLEKFPDFLNYTLAMEYSRNGNSFFGITTSFYTTGARNHLKDYSGEYKLDMILSGYRLGLQFRTILERWNKFDFNFEMKGGIIFSTLSVSEMTQIVNVSDHSDSFDFRSRTIFWEPSFRLNYSISSKLLVEFAVGYELNIDSSIYSKDNHDYDLTNWNGDLVHLNWSGARFMVGIGYSLF